MRPLHRVIELEDNDNNSKLVEYEVEYEIHPDYRGMSIQELKKYIDFSRDESVPDIAYVSIITPMENFDLRAVKDEIMFNEEITNNDDIQFIE